MQKNPNIPDNSNQNKFTIKKTNISYQLNFAFPKLYFVTHGILFFIASIYLLGEAIYQSIAISKFIYILFINFATVVIASTICFILSNKFLKNF